MAHVAFGDDVALFMIRRDAVWAVPRTVLTSDTAGVIVEDDAVIKLDVAVGGTSDKTGRLYAVVTAHGVKQQQRVGKTSPLHLTDAAPFDVARVIVLFITRHFATAASDAFGRIEMESVLLPLTKRRNIYGVVPALHSCVSFVADEGFQRGVGIVHVIGHL